jgi:uridylate kinase
MGMTATIINAFALRVMLNNSGIDAVIQNVLDYEFIKKDLNPEQAKKDLSEGKVVIFAGGTGQPYVSTDSAAAERAIEIEADVILSAKNGVDGVYTADPKLDDSAEFIEEISFDEIIEQELKVIDKKAMELLSDKNIDIILFNMNIMNNIVNVFYEPTTKKTIIRRK